MRLRFLFLPLLALAPAACRSTEPTTPTQNAESPEPEMLEAIGSDTESASGMSDPTTTDPANVASASFTEPEPFTASAGLQGTQLREDADRITRKRSQREFLAGESLKDGDQQFERGDLEGALVSYSQAIAVDPGNEQAREAMQKVEAMLGHRYAVVADTLADEVERAMVKRAQARIEAERFTVRGQAALRKADYDEAIQDFRSAEMILRYNPLIATESLDEQFVTGMLNQAVDLREEARQESERLAHETAQRASAEAERREDEYVESRLISLFNEANQSFLNENFRQAESYCDLVLLEDPGNQAATLLKENSQQARHLTTAERNRRDYKEQWLRTFADLDTMDVIQNDAVVFDDLDRWLEVTQRQPLEFSSRNASADLENRSVSDRLEEVRFAPQCGGEDGEGAPLADVANFLQTLTGINFIISTAVREGLGEEETMVNLQLPEYSVKKILDIIAEINDSLSWKIKDGVVKFVTAEELIGGQELVMYEVRDLIRPIKDFPGAEINIEPSGGISYPDEDIEEKEAGVVTGDLLDELIRNNIDPESWELDPANNLAIDENGVMVVNQTPAVHEKISQLLADLREATGIMVDIQSRFIRVEDNFLEDIGVDFRGLGQPGLGTNEFFDDFGDATTQAELGDEIGGDPSLGAYLDEGNDGDIRGRVEHLYDNALGDDNGGQDDPDGLQATGGLSFQWTYINDIQLELILRAVSKSERVELVSNPRILISNTGRSNLTVLNQVTYVKDFDVEIAQAASIADPIVDVIQDGVILDVRPVVSADRRFITLELRPTIAELKRPIRQVTTTLGSQASVTIELPELEIQRIRTSIPMPDGATVMLGGLKTSGTKDYRSGVPILNKIPLISMLFERKGKYIARKKLMVLLRADIVIPSESEPTGAQLGLRR
ncbi:MAG: type II secretory pathway component GspD/PulD (secretin)/tetratricopeptide (TPR) repeat protein [Candidatus Paceibacteria bacterium]|jgi:type II secretory pathway component GspD/PulD (secretin)/tetratricopeptide (TPR) repeat protein